MPTLVELKEAILRARQVLCDARANTNPHYPGGPEAQVAAAQADFEAAQAELAAFRAAEANPAPAPVRPAPPPADPPPARPEPMPDPEPVVEVELVAVPTITPPLPDPLPAAEPDEKPPLLAGSYWNGERYVSPTDEEWTAKAYHAATGETDATPDPIDEPDTKPTRRRSSSSRSRSRSSSSRSRSRRRSTKSDD